MQEPFLPKTNMATALVKGLWPCYCLAIVYDFNVQYFYGVGFFDILGGNTIFPDLVI